MCVKIEFTLGSSAGRVFTSGQGASFGEEAPFSNPSQLMSGTGLIFTMLATQSGTVHSGTTVTIVGANFALKGVRVKKADNHLERLRYYHHPQSTQVLKQHGRSLGDY